MCRRLQYRRIYLNEQENNMKQKGFTLIETLVAILILSVTMGALMSLAAGGFYSVRYARNQIAANALMQETLEFIRNSRDSAKIQGLTWDQWRQKFYVDQNGAQTGNPGSGCFSSNRCYIDPHTSDPQIRACSGGGSTCPAIQYYANQYFYGYNLNYPFSTSGQKYQTSFIRSVEMSNGTVGADQVIVTVTVEWLNGLNTKTVSQKMLLSNWTMP